MLRIQGNPVTENIACGKLHQLAFVAHGEQGYGGETPIGPEDCAALGPGKRECHVAGAIVGAIAHQQVRPLRLAVAITACATLVAGGYALDIVSQAKVDDTADGVRSVNRGGAAGDQFSRLHHHVRDAGEVRDTRNLGRDIAAAVNQHQRAHPAQASQIGAHRRASVLIRVGGGFGP